VIIHDLDVLGTTGRPAEAHAELVVHPDAVLPGAVTLERFKPIARRHPQIFQPACDLQLAKLSPGDRLDTLETLDSPAARKSLSLGTLERHDHISIVTLRVTNVKRDLIVLDPPAQRKPPKVEGRSAPENGCFVVRARRKLSIHDRYRG
jgi:hypothetical protein